MMPTNSRRSSILKQPLQDSRTPLQELDYEDDGPVNQQTSRRVSSSRASQIKDLDASLGDKTKWNQSNENSPESIEGDENQSDRANVIDEYSSFHTQKKSKRKRTPSVQSSLNSSISETSHLNQSPSYKSYARALKQPRKSSESSRAELSEEGDTKMFFDELNLTEPITCSYSQMDTSLNISRTMIDSVLDYTNLGKSQVVLPASGCVVDDPNTLNTVPDIPRDDTAEYESLNMSVDGVNIASSFNSDNTEVGNSSINAEIIENPMVDFSKEAISDVTVCNDEDEKDENTSDASATVVGDSDQDDQLSLSPSPRRDIHFRVGSYDSHETNSHEASMDLTIPQMQMEILPKNEQQQVNGRVSLNAQGNDLETTELGMTQTWGRIKEKRNSVMPSEGINIGDTVRDMPESLTNGLSADELIQEKLSNSTVSSGLEFPLTDDGAAIQEKEENCSVNTTIGSDFSNDVSYEGMELTVPLGKVKMQNAIVDAIGDNLKSSEISEVVFKYPNTHQVGSKLDQSPPKEMNEKTFIEETVSRTYYEGELDETCADIHGMDMTVSLGKIREKMPKTMDENVMFLDDEKRDSCLGEHLRSQSKTCKDLEQSKEAVGETSILAETNAPVETEPENDEFSKYNETETVEGADIDAVVMQPISLLQSNDELPENLTSEMESCSQLGYNTNSLETGMEVADPDEELYKKCVELVTDSEAYDPEDDINLEFTIMESTLTSGMGEECEVSCCGASFSQVMDDTVPGLPGMEMTLPFQNMTSDGLEDAGDNLEGESLVVESAQPDLQEVESTIPSSAEEMGENYEVSLQPVAEAQSMADLNSETVLMELTVPMGTIKGEKSECSPDDVLLENNTINETIPEPVGMNDVHTESKVMGGKKDLIDPLESLKGEKSEHCVHIMPPGSQIMDKTTPEADGEEFDVSLKGIKEVDDDSNELEVKIPSGKISGENLESPLKPLGEYQLLGDSNSEAMCLELADPLQRLKGIKPEFSTDNVPPESRVLNEATPETLGMELDTPLEGVRDIEGEDTEEIEGTMAITVPISKILNYSDQATGEESSFPVVEEESENCASSTSCSFNVNDASTGSVDLEVTSSKGELKEINCEGDVTEPIEHARIMNVTNHEALGMESSVLAAEHGGKNEKYVEITFTEFQLMDDTISDLTGMETTLPLGRLRPTKSKEIGNVDIYLDADKMNPKPLEVAFAAALVSFEEHTELDSSGDLEKIPKSDFGDCLKVLDVDMSEVEIMDTVPTVENKCLNLDATSADSYDEQIHTPSKSQGSEHLVDKVSVSPISGSDIDIQYGMGGDLNASLAKPDVLQDGGSNSSVSSDSILEVDIHSIDVQPESSIPLVCDEEMNHVLVGREIQSQEKEGIVPDQEDMEQSLHETMVNEPHDTDGVNTALNISNSMVEVEDISPETGSEIQAIGSDNLNSEERKSFSPSVKKECEVLFVEGVEKVFDNVSGVLGEVELKTSFTRSENGEPVLNESLKSNEEVQNYPREFQGDGDPIVNKSLESDNEEVETVSKYMEPETPYESCDEDVYHEASEYLEEEDFGSEQELMEQSLSEVTPSEAHTVPIVNTDFDNRTPKVEFKDTALDVGGDSGPVVSFITNTEEILSQSPCKWQESGDIYCYDGKNSSFEYGDAVTSKLSEQSKGIEINPMDKQADFGIARDQCEGKLIKEVEDETVENAEGNEIISEQKAMEQSLSEAMEQSLSEAMGCESHAFGTVSVDDVSEPKEARSNIIFDMGDSKEDDDSADNTSPNRQSFCPLEGRECDSISDEILINPVSESDVNTHELRTELSISFSRPDEHRVGDPILNESLKSSKEEETISGGITVESNLSLERCDEKLGQIQEEEVLGCQEGEEMVPEQEAMEQSLSESMATELQSVDFHETEHQELSETSFDRGEMMEVNSTPLKGSVTPNHRNSSYNEVERDSSEINEESHAANELCIETEVNVVLSIGNREELLEKSVVDRGVIECEDMPCGIWSNPVSDSGNETHELGTEMNVSYSRPDEQEDGDPSLNESLESYEEEETITASEDEQSHHSVHERGDTEPSLINASIEANCDAANSNDEVTSQSVIHEGVSIIGTETNAINLESEPTLDSDPVPTSESKELSDSPSKVPVNHAEEVPMEGVTFSELDSNRSNGDCLEMLGDVCGGTKLEPNGIESDDKIKIVIQHELDGELAGESDAHQMIQESCKEDVINEETFSAVTNQSDSTAVIIEAANPGECPKYAASILDWIREESSKGSCDWKVCELLENQYSFMAFHEAVMLIVSLVPLDEDQESIDDRIVEGVELKSCVSDNSDLCLNVVLSVMLKRLSSSFLSSKCSTTKQLPSLFELLNSEFLAMNLLLLQMYDLMRASPVTMKNDGFSFLVLSQKRMLLFEVQVNLLNWDVDGVKSDDVHVNNVIGKMGFSEVWSVFKSIKCDEQYFRNIYRDVINYIFTLESVL